MKKAEFYIKFFNLQKHPEGGYFGEVYRSTEHIPVQALPQRFSGFRCYSTSIYFLLPGNEFSAFHRIKSDEIWHFYKGAPVRIHVIDPKGNYSEVIVGDDPERGESFQAVICAGCWFAAETTDPESFSLAGCTVSPGFDFSDFELAKRHELIKLFPAHINIIERFTHQ